MEPQARLKCRTSQLCGLACGAACWSARSSSVLPPLRVSICLESTVPLHISTCTHRFSRRREQLCHDFRKSRLFFVTRAPTLSRVCALRSHTHSWHSARQAKFRAYSPFEQAQNAPRNSAAAFETGTAQSSRHAAKTHPQHHFPRHPPRQASRFWRTEVSCIVKGVWLQALALACFRPRSHQRRMD